MEIILHLIKELHKNNDKIKEALLYNIRTIKSIVNLPNINDSLNMIYRDMKLFGFQIIPVNIYTMKTFEENGYMIISDELTDIQYKMLKELYIMSYKYTLLTGITLNMWWENLMWQNESKKWYLYDITPLYFSDQYPFQYTFGINSFNDYYNIVWNNDKSIQIKYDYTYEQDFYGGMGIKFNNNKLLDYEDKIKYTQIEYLFSLLVNRDIINTFLSDILLGEDIQLDFNIVSNILDKYLYPYANDIQFMRRISHLMISNSLNKKIKFHVSYSFKSMLEDLSTSDVEKLHQIHFIPIEYITYITDYDKILSFDFNIFTSCEF